MPYCFSTDMQEEDIVFGGEKKLRAGDPGGLRPLPSQGDRHLLHLPGGPDRRRRPRRGPRDEGEARHQRLRLQLRGLQGREPVGRPPHRQQPAFQARHRPGRHAARRASSTSTCSASTTSAATPSCSRTSSSAAASTWWPPSAATRRMAKFENAHTADLNVVMCHRSINYVADMMEKKLRHPLVQGELHRRRGHGQVAAQDRRVLRRRGADRPGRGGDRRGNGRGREGARARSARRCEGKTAMLFVGGSRAHHYQDLFTRDRHEDGGRRLRVRPPRRLRRPPRAARPSRSTPTAATSRSCTSSPIPSGTAPAQTTRKWPRLASRGHAASTTTRA